MSEAQIEDNQVEIEQVEPEFQIEVEDDTPPEDRNRTPLPQNLVEELEKDDLEEYSDKVKKRLSQMKKVWHDERRAKETFAREREEAIRFAQAQAEENKQLKQRLNNGTQAYFNELAKSTKSTLEMTKAKLKAAYEAGDSEAMTSAQEELADLKLRQQQINKQLTEVQQVARQQQENVVKQPQRAEVAPRQAPKADPKALSWQQKNQWFGANEEMTALALGLHEKLVRSGVDPTSDEYYRQVDTTMRKRFPEEFGDENTQTTEQDKPVRAQKAANVVAPATRSSAPKQIRLTQTQVALAKRLGLSNEAYARELIKLENN
jgi:hypothetical protein